MDEVEADSASISPSSKQPQQHEGEGSQPKSPTNTSSLPSSVDIAPDPEDSKLSSYVKSDKSLSHRIHGTSRRIEELRAERKLKLGLLVDRLQSSQSNLSPTISQERQRTFKPSSPPSDWKPRLETSQGQLEGEESLDKPSRLERKRGSPSADLKRGPDLKRGSETSQGKLEGGESLDKPSKLEQGQESSSSDWNPRSETPQRQLEGGESSDKPSKFEQNREVSSPDWKPELEGESLDKPFKRGSSSPDGKVSSEASQGELEGEEPPVKPFESEQYRASSSPVVETHPKNRQGQLDGEAPLDKPPELEQNRERQQGLNETRQELSSISSNIQSVLPESNLIDSSREFKSSRSSVQPDDLDQEKQQANHPTTGDRLGSQNQMIIDSIRQQLSSFPDFTPTKPKGDNPDQSGTAQLESIGNISLTKNRRGLSHQHKKFQGHLSSLLKHHEFFETRKMQELRRKRDNAQQNVMTIVSRSRDASPELLERGNRKTEASESASKQPSTNMSKLDQLRRKRARSYDKAQSKLALLGDSSSASPPSKQSSGESSSPSKTQPGQELHTRCGDANSTEMRTAIESMTTELPAKRRRSELASTPCQTKATERHSEVDHGQKLSQLSQTIKKLQQKVEKLKEENASDKARLEGELHDARIETEMFKGKYEESQLRLAELKEETANKETPRGRKQVRFNIGTQMWRHRATGLLDQIRELQMALQDQTQMRMMERINFFRHIALLEKENLELKIGSRIRRAKSKPNAECDQNGASPFSFIGSACRSLLSFEMNGSQRRTSSMPTWHPLKAMPKAKNRQLPHFNVSKLAQRGGELLSWEVLKGAFCCFGILGLALMSDASHASPDSGMFLRFGLPVQSLIRR